MPSWDYYLNDTPASSPGGGSSSGPITALVGTGIRAPFRRASSDLATARGVEMLKNNLAQILGIRAGSRYTTGELPWRTEFGSLLHLLRHRNNDPTLAELARIYVVEAIGRWEPRVLVRDVTISKERQNAGDIETPILLIAISFDIRSTSGSIVSRGETLTVAS